MKLSKFFPALTAHLDTMRDQDSGEFVWSNIARFYIAPALVGLVFTLLGVRISTAAEIISGASILSGFLFGLSIFVFELKMKMMDDEGIPKGSPNRSRIDNLFANVVYSIMVGLVLVACAVSQTTFTAPKLISDHVDVEWLSTFAILTISVHYVLTLLMCVRKVRWAYSWFSK